ncbi:MAG TPA: hypothetical protein VLU25_05080, partial [Acidobacteriota bacterium]|nr:hypothetical protein [Acidobacteriota bacterium]
MSRAPRDVDFSRFPLEDAVRLLGGVAMQVMRQVLAGGAEADREGGKEAEEDVLRPRLSEIQVRLLEKSLGQAGTGEKEKKSKGGWWTRLRGLLRLKRNSASRETQQSKPSPAPEVQAAPYLTTLRWALGHEAGEEEWRRQILGKMWDELGGRPGGAMPDLLWELAGQAAFRDPHFQRLAAEASLRHLKHNRLLTGELTPLQFHPNAFWFLLAVAELPAPRLQHLARRKLLEDQWTGEWEAWLMGLVSQRFPQSLDKLSL